MTTLLRQTPILKLFDTGAPLISVNKSTTIRDVLQVLSNNNISSVSVADQSIAAFPKHIAGFVDFLDILSFLVVECKSLAAPYIESGHLAATFLDTSVGSILDFSSRDTFNTVLEEENVFQVIIMFGQGVHRVGIVDILQEVQHIITQTDIARVICGNPVLLGDLASRTLESLGLISSTSHTLVAVNAQDPALLSFTFMNQNKVGASPVLDSKGMYVGTLSASDLKTLNEHTFGDLTMRTQDYAEKHSSVGATTPSSALCFGSDTLLTAVQRILSGKLHRAWILDEQYKPIGVVTLTDVCRLLSLVPPVQV